MDNRQDRQDRERRGVSAPGAARDAGRTIRWTIKVARVSSPIAWIVGGIFFFLIIFVIFFAPGGTSTSLALPENQQGALPPRSGGPIASDSGTLDPLPIDSSSCPIPNGTPSCGSKNVPRSACGHCSASYTAAYGCNYYSLQFAIDIPGPEGSSIILPAIGGERIRWTWLDQPKNVNNTAIQRYAGLNEETGEQYLIKFHHSTPGSGGGTKYTGEAGATICTSPCDSGTGPHVHTEFAKVNSDGSNEWVDAPLYFCN